MDAVRKVALVTGSTSGIGLAIAKTLAKNGVDLVITGFGDEVVIGAIINEIKSHSVQVTHVPADLRNVADMESLCSQVNQLYPDGVDILVNDAGFNHVSTVEDYPDDKWDDMVAVMLSAPFHLTKRLLPSMKKKGWGRIINMSSQMGLISAPGKAVYSAVKHGLIGLTKGVALETASHGITCNAVCPGFTNTPAVRTQIEERAKQENVPLAEIEKNLLESVPIKKFNSVEQIAELVEFLCLSSASSQMTGATFLIDQGYTAQ